MIAESLSVYINNYLGLAGLTIGNIAMFAIAGILLYLGIVKHYEPLLLVPIAVGIILGNIPLTGLTRLPTDKVFGGLLHYIGFGTWNGLYPPLIFIGIGALTDFSALIANPITILL
ncbi:MAG: sodium ion-translocating decarboxylase subunit beta, partial [Clostridia bacterium]|nr:sodium ion-translocating decarboxylase subunit beta [Clostridia bacterium]